MPVVARRIRLVKERRRGILNTLPFKKMPQVMLIELIYLNAFPTKTGVSKVILPREILFRQKIDLVKHCQAVFGSYCEVHDEPTPTNTMVTQATLAIVLGPMGNLQGTYKLYNLATGK
jgi:hypothetical protein